MGQQFQMRIQCDNAAFEDDTRAELARILRDVANRLERGDAADTHLLDETDAGLALDDEGLLDSGFDA